MCHDPVSPESIDKSAPLAIVLTEQQWLLVGGLIAQGIKNPTLPENLRPALYQAALTIQRALNRLWFFETSGQGKPIANFAGEQWINPRYLYGAKEEGF